MSDQTDRPETDTRSGVHKAHQTTAGATTSPNPSHSGPAPEQQRVELGRQPGPGVAAPWLPVLGLTPASPMCDRLDPDDDGLINQQGCGQLYLKLEECLGEHERDWRRCQAEARPLPRPPLPQTASSPCDTAGR